MRKRMTPEAPQQEQMAGWLNLPELAEVEMTSEDPAYSIESALGFEGGAGWRAASPGPQRIRFIFDEPQRLRRIQLQINEAERPRTQELALRWSADRGQSYREIVRQQYNFSPSGATTEREEYQVDLAGVTALEIEIIPDIAGSGAIASLARLRVG